MANKILISYLKFYFMNTHNKMPDSFIFYYYFSSSTNLNPNFVPKF